MGNIVLLDELTINKIAAGEVIERPASVVKEMVENAIDAGADSISIEVKNGGISYIRITDNGKGIAADDMDIAFERHATSKIRSADDLETVKSMGFRGEALASIAAISNVEMVSKAKNNDTGNRIVVEAGRILTKEEAGCPVGTTITVTNLFFNTPVRYKFLKKDFTEAGYIEDSITRLALVNPGISFKLINSGKVVIQTSGNGDMQSVIYSIYGKDVAEGIVPVEYTYEDITIKGVVGKPEIARSNRAYQLFFVNGRYVKDKTLSGAAEKGFKGMLPIGKYGFLSMNLEVSPNKVDVNVHPAKLEVRFEEDQKVFKAVYHAIQDTLLKTELVATTEKTREDEMSVTRAIPIFNPEIKKESRFGGLFGRGAKLSPSEEMEEKEIEEVKEYKPAPAVTGWKSNEAKREVQEVAQESPVMSQLIELQRKVKEELEQSKRELELKKQTSETIVQTIEKQEKEEEPKQQEEYMEQEKDRAGGEENLKVEEMLESKQKEQEEEEEEVAGEESEEYKEAENTKTMELKDMLEKLEDAKFTPNTADFDEMYMKMFGKLPAKEGEEETTDRKDYEMEESILKPAENISVFEELEEYTAKPNYKLVGITFSTYIILEMEQELYIMDQHAAHERIMYEKVKKNFYDDKEKDSQLMILPDVITLTHKEMEIAKDNLGLFEQAGFMIEEFGENTIKISGTPSICLDINSKELFLETLDEINTVARTAKQEIEEKFISTVACKAAVKANMALTKEEIESLLDELLVLPNPFTCPHGRPTAIKMTKYDIEKKFSRR